MPSGNELNNIDAAVIVALGSNLAGDYASPQDLLEAALAAFPEAGLKVERRSGWWRSAAWPDPADPAFVNGVAIIETSLSPAGALQALHDLEARFGRRRHQQNAPRTLDLDLIAFGRAQSDSPALPHPRAHERAFVMRPLAEIAPDWLHPMLGLTAAQLALAATVGEDARRIDPAHNLGGGLA
jgi:2-amino-4-hydroxy-6-hydroxymethyldihydropteridine diphosphokinase